MKKVALLGLVVVVLLSACVGHITIVVTATPSLQPSPSAEPPTPIPSTSIPPTPTQEGTQVNSTAPLAPASVSTVADAPTPTPIPPTAAPNTSSAPTDIPPAPSPTATATPLAGATTLWMSPDAPPELQPALDVLVASGHYAWSTEQGSAIKLVSGGHAGGLNAQWLYVPVVPFPTVADNVNWADIQNYWKGNTAALMAITGGQQAPEFVATQPTVDWLTSLLGAPASSIKIEVVPPDAVETTLWLRRPNAWGIVPFDRLDPAEKSLTLDGASIFDRSLALDKYPLTQAFGFTGDNDTVSSAAQAITATGKWATTNRDLSKMTILVMTGTTALTRATAYAMETEGITLPARDILPFMQDADFVHVSNEVAFTPTCPYPNPSYEATGLTFCSRDTYLKLLQTIHMNVVELTGNHVNDWGRDAFAHTLDLYDQNKIPYFGGGQDTTDARKAAIVQKDGNTIAFIGCNPVGPIGAWATDTEVGAAKCDDAFLSKEIPRLKTVANVVVMTLQYQEYYQYSAPPDQVAYFQKYADMGADLVMGSQAHQPQAFAFTANAFIHYGVGNLFFDQMDDIATRQMFADKIIIYSGKHISTVLFTGLNEDYSRPRPMTADERTSFLQTIFQASGW